MHKDGLHERVPFRTPASASGQAALLLVESLIHELVALGHLPLDRAIAVVDIAIDTAAEIALAQVDERPGHDLIEPLLRAIGHTLSLDAGDLPLVDT